MGRTTVEIRAAEPGTPSRSIITFKTVDEFERNLANLEYLKSNPNEEVIQSGTAAIEEEIAQIRQHKRQIFAHLRPPIEKKYDNLEDLKVDIEQYITDEIISRAVSNIVLYIKDLSFSLPDKEIIIQDLPGYDSPDKSHQKHTEEKLKDSDLIIFVYPIHERVDLKAPHIAMLNISEAINKAITTKEKLFIFLNKVDKIQPWTQENIEKHIKEAMDEWGRYSDVANKSVVGSAEGYLAEHKRHSGYNIEKMPEIGEKLKSFNISTGIETMISLVNTYLDTERPRLMLKGLQVLEKAYNEYAEAVKSFIEQKYSISEISNDPEMDSWIENASSFNSWYDKKLPEITDRFNEWYIKEVLKKDDIDIMEDHLPATLVSIKNKHLDTITGYIESFNVDEKELRKIHIGNLQGQSPKPSKTNFDYREFHYIRCMELLEQYSATLSETLKELINQIFQWVSANGFPDMTTIEHHFEVKFRKDDEKWITYDAAIRALILRFARPIVRTFLVSPQATTDRKNKVNEHIKEIKTLPLYSVEDMNFFKDVQEYNAEEPQLQSDEFEDYFKQERGGITADLGGQIPQTKVNISLEHKLIGSKSANDFEEILGELKTDINTIIELLKDPIFEASGVNYYCFQEVEKAKEFVKNQLSLDNTELRNLIAREFMKNNIRIPELEGAKSNIELKSRDRIRATDVYGYVWLKASNPEGNNAVTSNR